MDGEGGAPRHELESQVTPGGPAHTTLSTSTKIKPTMTAYRYIDKLDRQTLYRLSVHLYMCAEGMNPRSSQPALVSCPPISHSPDVPT